MLKKCSSEVESAKETCFGETTAEEMKMRKVSTEMLLLRTSDEASPSIIAQLKMTVNG